MYNTNTNTIYGTKKAAPAELLTANPSPEGKGVKKLCVGRQSRCVHGVGRFAPPNIFNYAL